MKSAKKQPSVVAEAWQRMTEDFERWLPERFHGAKGRLRLSLLLAFFELVVLGVVGKLVYDWLKS